MFTVNIKGKRNPKNIEFTKLEIIFYKRGYTRVAKVLNITGLYQDWNHQTQSFTGQESAAKNKLLQQEKLKYLKIAERWNAQDKDWIPVELSHYYDNDPKYRNRYTTVAEMIDELFQKFQTQERYKNGRILTSQTNAKAYRYLKASLERFTHSKYRRDFAKYRFRDLNEQFLLDYTVWTQIQGSKQGNQGGVSNKLKKLRAVCRYAKEAGVYNVNLNIFLPVKSKLKPRSVIPKGVAPDVIRQIEMTDRSILDKKECFYLDLFLFSYYAGGMSAIDVC